jgi:formylglycine-generating enzyme required for sulfatase activity
VSPLQSLQSALLLVAAAATLSLLGGCDDAATPVEPEGLDPRVAHLERWVPQHDASGGLFFLDRFEARIEEYAQAFPERRPELSGYDEQLPITRIDALESLELARCYWGRLPRADEWSQAVSGSVGYRYPWGDRLGGNLRANTAELGLWRPARVGSFESGRNPGRAGSCYDLIGNVAEWTLTPTFERENDFDTGGLQQEELVWIGHLLSRLGISPSFDPLDLWIAPAPEALRAPSVEIVPVLVLGQSFADRLDLAGRAEPRSRSARPPLEWASTIGVRFATDPFTFLARLDASEGAPSAADERALRAFLLAHRAEFAEARRTLDAPTLQLRSDATSLRSISAWGLYARRVLGP